MQKRNISPTDDITYEFFTLLIATDNYSRVIQEFGPIRNKSCYFVWISAIQSLVFLGHPVKVITDCLGDMEDFFGVNIDANAYCLVMEAFWGRMDHEEGVWGLYCHSVERGVVCDVRVWKQIYMSLNLRKPWILDFNEVFRESEEEERES